LFLDFQVGRRLSIKRTFKTADGKQFIRIEVVKNQAVIDAYLKFNKDKSIKYSFPSSFFIFYLVHFPKVQDTVLVFKV